MKKVTVAAARKALNAVEGDATRYERCGDELTVWADDYDAKEREEIIATQAIEWLTANGYDTARAGVRYCGYNIGIEWNRSYSYTSELVALNID